MINRRSAMLLGLKQSRLPSEYQEVEYVYNNSQSYINTGVIGKSGVTMECEISFPIVNNDSVILGSRLNQMRFFPLATASSQLNYGYDAYVRTRHLFSIDTVYKLSVILNAGEQKIFLNDIVYYTTNNGTEVDTQLPMYLFACNYGGSANYYCLCKIYKLILWEDDVVVRNFVPCYRKSDNVAGMYDLISKTFFTNVGTGEFLIGDDV